MRFALVSIVLIATGCGGSLLDQQRQAAHAMAVTVNAATAEARHHYERAQLSAIDRVCGEGTVERSLDGTGASGLECAAEARQEVNRVRDRWRPLWVAHESVMIAHRFWVDMISLDSSTSRTSWAFVVGRVLRAYVEFQSALSLLGPEVGDAPELVRELAE